MNSKEVAKYIDDIRKENLAPGDVFIIKVKQKIPRDKFALLKSYFNKKHPGVDFIVLDDNVTMERDRSAQCPLCAKPFLDTTKAGDKFRSLEKQCTCKVEPATRGNLMRQCNGNNVCEACNRQAILDDVMCDCPCHRS